MPRRTTEYVTFGMIACAVGLTGYYVYDHGRASTSEQTARAGLLIHVFRPDDVTRVTIDRKGEHIEIVREGDGYKLTSPRTANAEFLAVTALLNAIGGARSERAVGNPTADDRKSFGLDAPRAVVEVAMKGVTVRVSLGASVTVAGDDGNAPSYYVEVAPYGDDKGGVFVVAAEVARAIDRGSEVYREPSLLADNKSMEFSRVTVTTHATTFALERGGHGEWRLASGVPEAPIRADADVADALFGAFGDLKADPFISDDTPVDVTQGGTLSIDLKKGGQLELVYGGPCPASADAGGTGPKLVVVQLRKPQKITGCVPAVIVERLDQVAARFVDGHVFGLLFGSENAKISEIESVSLEHAGQKVVDVERRGDGLHLRVPNDEQVDKDSSDRFLRHVAGISGVVVVKPVDTTKLGLSPPEGRVLLRRRISTLTTGDEGADGGSSNEWMQIVEVGKPMTLEGSKPALQVVYLHRLDDDAYLRIDAGDALAFGAASALDLRSPNLLDLPPEVIERIAVTTTIAGAIPYEINRTGAAFNLVAPAGLGADASAISELTHHLSTLTCTRWAADRDDGTFGFATPQATIAIRRTAPAIADAGGIATEIAIDFGSSTNDGGVHARVHGRDAVCVLPEAKLAALLRPPVDRTVVGFDPTDAPRFVIARPGGTSRDVTFDGKAWHDGSDASTPAADVIARKIADLVVGLRIERLAHLGAALPNEGFATPTLTIQAYDALGKPKKHVTIGASGKVDTTLVYYARVDGIDGTYAIAREDIDKLLTGL